MSGGIFFCDILLALWLLLKRNTNLANGGLKPEKSESGNTMNHLKKLKYEIYKEIL